MDSKTIEAISAKEFFALVNGIYKREFEKDQQITLEFLKQEIFPSKSQITLPILQNLVERVSELIQDAAKHNHDLSQFETVLKDVKKHFNSKNRINLNTF